MAAEIDIVHLGRAPRLEDEDELVLRAVERAHPTVRLVPDADVFEIVEDLPARFERDCQLTPLFVNDTSPAFQDAFGLVAKLPTALPKILARKLIA